MCPVSENVEPAFHALVSNSPTILHSYPSLLYLPIFLSSYAYLVTRHNVCEYAKIVFPTFTFLDFARLTTCLASKIYFRFLYAVSRVSARGSLALVVMSFNDSS